jgi:putative transposase
MSHYRRVRIKGGTYFFTVNLDNRNSRLLIEHYKLLSASIKKIKKARPFLMPGWVILPDHFHCLWTLPEKDDDFSGRWRSIKTLFTKECKKCSGNLRGKIWQHRFWEHTIRNETDFYQHLDYIHINPLKHGHVKQVCDWPYSSFHYLVSKGRYSKNWGSDKQSLCDLDLGER